MLKKLISCLCVLALLSGLLPGWTLPSAKAEALLLAVENTYQVGYARVDINPYVVEDDPSSGIMALPLAGYGDVWNRLSTDGLLDDNGDGVVDQNDGLKATCIAISDQEGKTILMITVDLVGPTLIDQVRTAVLDRVNAAIADGRIPGAQPLTTADFYYAGTHTHAAPDLTAYTTAGKTGTNNDGVSLSTVNENLGIWIQRTLVDIGDAAIAALQDRGSARLSKDQLSAGSATSPLLQDKLLNTTRHYNTEVNGEKFVTGSNFNPIQAGDYDDPSVYKTNHGTNPTEVTEPDDTLYMLRFVFEDSRKLPILLSSWRAHPVQNSNNNHENSSKNAISSDYVNAFRHALEYGCTVQFEGKRGYITDWTLGTTRKYRVAFFSGTGGNINPRNYETITYSGTEGDVVQRGYFWIDASADLAKVKGRGGVYGVTLATLAQECLTDGLNETAVTAGKIRTTQLSFYATRKTTGISKLSYKAALDWKANATTITRPYKYTDPDTGESYIISSSHHANRIISSWKTALDTPTTTPTKVDLGVFLLGQDVAFVSVPGEPFDYYYRDTTLTGDAKFAPENNLWNDLIDEETYGKPFVLGYCNGYIGYFPNYESYIYSQGSEKWATGSYEANASGFEQGTGEQMVRIFDQVLTSMAQTGGVSYTAPCDHCGDDQLWEPYSAQTTLTTGHYYLYDDTQTTIISISGEQTVCIDLKGHTLTADSRPLYTSDTTRDTLNIMDSSPQQTGVVQGCGGSCGAASGFAGGTILIAKGDVLNLYGGTLTAYEKTGYSTAVGGVLRIGGTFNMYGGTVVGGTAGSFTGSYVSGSTVKTTTRTGRGGCISLSGTMNLYGGEIRGGQLVSITGTVEKNESGANVFHGTSVAAEGKGSCVYVDAGGIVNLYGDTSVGQLQFAGSEGLTVNGNYTGTTQLKFDTLTDLQDLTVVGQAVNADVSHAHISLADAPGKTLAVKGTALVVSDSPYPYGTCPVCGDCRWISMTDADFDALGSDDLTPGHYVLTGDVTTATKRLNYNNKHPGTFCVDLAGHTFAGDSRAFTAYSGAVLNILDSTGGGRIEGNTDSETSGGALFVLKGEMHLYGGTVAHMGEQVSMAGAIRIHGGTFTLHDGTVEGGNAVTCGGTVYITSNSGVDGRLIVRGGQVRMGQAGTVGNCVYVGDRGFVELYGDGTVAEICYAKVGANRLFVSGDYSGTAQLCYETGVDLTEGTVLGTLSGDGDLSQATITFKDIPCKTLAVAGDSLVVADIPQNHSYQVTVTAPSCTEDGYTTYTCQLCGETDIADVVAATGHRWVEETCTEAKHCTLCSATEGVASGHRYETVTVTPTCTEDGSVTDTCSVCGDEQVETIPATGHHHEAVITPSTCTEDGYTTYTCHCGDSYITDRITAPGHIYDTVVTKPTCTVDGKIVTICTTCGDTTEGIVPATGHSFENGVCTTCGEADPDYVKPSTVPTLSMRYPSLSFEDVIIMNVYYTAENLQDVVEMGLITNTVKPGEVSLENAEAVIPGYGIEGEFYFSSTEGIAPKDIGDTIYFAVYAKLADGTVVYTKMIGYSPKTYALNQLTTGSAEMRPLVAAMLGYGAAAQVYFGYKTDSLVNATMTEDQKALVEAYRADMIASVTQASGAKLGTFINDKTYSQRYPTISFEGAFCINYYFQPSLAVEGDVMMYVWSLEDYEAAEVLTRENATKAIRMELTGSGEYMAVVDGIAAKDLDKAAYVSFVYNDGTTEHCGGVIAYTIGMYCKSQASGTGTLSELAKACAVYGYYAKQLFN